MLRMDGFRYAHASSPEEAVALFQSEPQARYLAGGTDLLPDLKHRILSPALVIGIARALPRGAREVDGPGGPEWEIGAGTRLAEVAALPGLAPLPQAASRVASPQIRNMGTLGGNIMLSPRCRYYNQSQEWRTALGGCLRAIGDICHVTNSPKTCVAAQSSDTVPALLVLGARVRLLGPQGSRELPVADLYRFDGMDHLVLSQGELLTHVLVPVPPVGAVARYDKLQRRGSIDFPLLSIATWATFQGDAPDALRIAVGAVSPQPKLIPGLDPFLGQPLDDERIEQIAELVFKRVRPQAALMGDPAWRRSVARVTVRRALQALREEAAA